MERSKFEWRRNLDNCLLDRSQLSRDEARRLGSILKRLTVRQNHDMLKERKKERMKERKNERKREERGRDRESERERERESGRDRQKTRR